MKNIKTLFNKVYRSLCRKAKFTFYNEKFRSLSKDIKKTKSTIILVLCRKKKEMLYFISNGNNLSDNFEIANGFNNFLLAKLYTGMDEIVYQGNKLSFSQYQYTIMSIPV